jgi:hypothetical protein
MPPKRKVPRKWGRRRPARPVKKAAASKPNAAGLTRRLQGVAALEHLLLELNLCSREDLRRARDFVKDQEA